MKKKDFSNTDLDEIQEDFPIFPRSQPSGYEDDFDSEAALVFSLSLVVIFIFSIAIVAFVL